MFRIETLSRGFSGSAAGGASALIRSPIALGIHQHSPARQLFFSGSSGPPDRARACREAAVKPHPAGSARSPLEAELDPRPPVQHPFRP